MRRLLIIILSIAIYAQAAPKPLKKDDIHLTMNELFTYHVEHKELTSQIVKRSFKLYIEQFDPAKIYLLNSEVKPFLEMGSHQVDQIIAQYLKGDFSEYEKLNQTIVKAISRAKKYRNEIKSTAKPEPLESYPGYAKSNEQLKERINAQFSRFLNDEKPTGELTDDKKNKLFELWEKRLVKNENSYTNHDKKEHYFTLHMLKALAKSLDSHTGYFSPEEAQELRTALEKQFEGIGVVLKEGIDGVMIVGLIKGGPAQKCGKILEGDVLHAIDQKKLHGITYEEILQRLKGKRGEKILLTLRRKEELVEVELKREKIIMEGERVQYTSVPFADGYIGKIDLPSFYESEDGSSCEKDLKEAIKNLKAEGKLLGLILDMRENAGGFLNQAVKVGGLFITSGVIVISKYAEGEIQYLRDIDGKTYYTGPLVIMTSKASASAAEIVAQALQDYGTALVVGDERTYGKGSIQFQTVTEDNPKAFFKVTVGRYYTVSGKSTQIDGVKSDILLPSAYSAFHIGEKFLEFPLPKDNVNPAFIDLLNDVEPKNKIWFQKNYLPYLQKKDLFWRKMIPTLQENCSYRITHSKDFTIYQKAMDESSTPLPKEGKWGVEDLQLNEAVNIVADMIALEADSQRVSH